MFNEIIIGTIRLPWRETIRMPFGLYGQNNTLSRYPYSVYLIFQRGKSNNYQKLMPKTISSSFLIANAVCLSDI
jgi:hypothetical protein